MSTTTNREEYNWRAFYVKPRHEKAIRDRYTQSAMELYCPTKTVKKKWADRWKMVEEVLLPGYILAKVTETERRSLLEDESILRNVHYIGKPASIREEEIELLKCGLEEADSFETEALQAGIRVRITEGVFQTKEGIIEELRKNKEVLIRLESLQIQVRIKVNESYLEKINQEQIA